MNTFPSEIMPPSSCPGGVFDPLDEATMDTGDDAARAVFSVPRQQPWNVTWPAMPTDQYDILEAFQAAQRATPFLMPHPFKDETWEVRFKSNPISYQGEGGKFGVLSVTMAVQPIRKVS